MVNKEKLDDIVTELKALRKAGREYIGVIDLTKLFYKLGIVESYARSKAARQIESMGYITLKGTMFELNKQKLDG